MAAPYTISKAALNALVAKYNVAYRSQGILFMSISPGFVDTSEGKTSKASFRLHSKIVC
jgi:NAD(P)-dependent dehydrogenase (short-subunit alcohol dehydrogenase family)